MKFTIYTSKTRSSPQNTIYPDKHIITTPESLRAAVSLDHVTALFHSSRRAAENFISSDAIVMDCDNDHTDDQSHWITPSTLDDLLPDTPYAIAFSRSHMLPKKNRSPRPRFHVYFETAPITSATAHAALKEAVCRRFPFFDSNALDAARFIFGADSPEIIWHEGWTTIDELLSDDLSEPAEPAAPTAASAPPSTPYAIREGTRNRTLSRFAGRVVIRYGDTDKARTLFLDQAALCDPPLPEAELRTIWASAVRFGKKVSASPDYIPPDRYNEDDFTSLRPADYSDIGEAKILVREYGAELLYTDSTDFLRYNGVYWQESKQMAIHAMMEFLDLQLQDAKDNLNSARKALLTAGVTEDDIDAGGKTLEKAAAAASAEGTLDNYVSAEKYLAFVMKHRDYKYVISSLNQAKPLVLTDIDLLDAQPFLLNTPAATYDLRGGLDSARPHDPSDCLTKCTFVSPGDEGSDLWKETLDLVFCHDKDLIAYVQRIVGMAAVGKVFSEALIISYGDGANGKSTFWNTISRVLGSYSGMISADTLTVGCRRNVKPEMAELKGKRLIIAAELEEGMRLNTSTVKQLCSTDEIEAEKKYKDPFKYTPTHTIVLYTNHLPKVGATDDGTWRRLIVIPFQAKIQGNSDIKNYTDYLVENAGPAVMGWIIEGAQKAISAGFHLDPPQCVRRAVEAYREGNDWLAHFLEECCDVSPDLSERSGLLYQQYRSFCLETGEYVRSTTDFYTALEASGYSRHKDRTGITISGLSLK